jgi:hypothetical protein
VLKNSFCDSSFTAMNAQAHIASLLRGFLAMMPTISLFNHLKSLDDEWYFSLQAILCTRIMTGPLLKAYEIVEQVRCGISKQGSS